VRNDFNTITENIPVARRLDYYSTPRWRNIEFYMLPTPGHTLGSIALLAIAADVMCNGKYCGQITEAVVEMKGALV
jgi:hypothetical protein